MSAKQLSFFMLHRLAFEVGVICTHDKTREKHMHKEHNK